MNYWIALPSRRLLAIIGVEALPFLQGLVTQDVLKGDPCFTALLTPQGRLHSDFFVIPLPEYVLLDCDVSHAQSLKDLLAKFQSFHNVTITDLSKKYAVCVAIGPQVHEFFPGVLSQSDKGEIFYPDPRHLAMGIRALIPYKYFSALPHPLLSVGREEHYHLQRLSYVIAEGAYDLIPDKSVILEYGYHEWGAVCWEKGCYMGQELMARTFHRGELRKHAYGLHRLSGDFPPMGTELFYEGEKIGLMGSHCQDLGLACLYKNKLLPQSMALQWDTEVLECSVFVRPPN